MGTYNPVQLTQLRIYAAQIRTVDPDSAAYGRLVALLDSLDQPMLRLIADAKIKFISPLAHNRLAR